MRVGAIDYSFARPSPTELKAAGVTAVGRYLTGPGKAISVGELQGLLAEGIAVWLCFEIGSDDQASGPGGGARNAEASSQALTRLGLPIDTPVYFTVDEDLPDPHVAIPYFEGIASERPVASNGVYGEGALCQLLHDEELASWYWQTMSGGWTGNASTLSITHIQQSTSPSPVPGSDLDLVMKADFGQWPRPSSTPTVTAEGGDMIARDPKTGGYWVARPNGNLYAFDGAPYLGPAPRFIEAWKIGPGQPVGPVTGITDDGAGGFVLSADNGDPAGIPATYHIDSSGQFAK